MNESHSRGERYLLFGIKPRSPAMEMPTQQQLAMLAASIAPSRSDNPENETVDVLAGKLCARALNLWFASQNILSLQKQCNEDKLADDSKTVNENKKLQILMPKDSEFPMKREGLCQKIWPKVKNTGTRANFFKDWLAHGLIIKYGPGYNPTAEEINSEFKQWGSVKIEKNNFLQIATQITKWYLHHKTKNISKMRSNAAHTRHGTQPAQQQPAH